MNKKRVFVSKGFMDMMPLNLAVLPWGILCGSLCMQRDFTVIEALLMPILVFAGAVQLVSIELIAGNAPLATILLTTFIVSSRHFLYGLALREKMQTMSHRCRFVTGFLLTDELFAFSGNKKAYSNKYRRLYAISAGGSFYLFWQLWNVIGIAAGSMLPDLTEIGLEFGVAVTFIALVIPGIKNIPTLVAVVSSAVAAIMFSIFQIQLELVGAALIGMTAGYCVNRWQIRRNIAKTLVNT